MAAAMTALVGTTGLQVALELLAASEAVITVEFQAAASATAPAELRISLAVTAVAPMTEVMLALGTAALGLPAFLKTKTVAQDLGTAAATTELQTFLEIAAAVKQRASSVALTPADPQTFSEAAIAVALELLASSEAAAVLVTAAVAEMPIFLCVTGHRLVIPHQAQFYSALKAPLGAILPSLLAAAGTLPVFSATVLAAALAAVATPP